MTEQLSFVLTKIILIKFILILYLPVCFSKTNVLYLAGGCFWCTEKSFQEFPGVIEAISGYCNGKKETANYAQVSSGSTKHRECLLIKYDEVATDLEKLLINYIKYINPMDLSGQFADRGDQYKIEIYFNNEYEKNIATNVQKIINQKKIYEIEIKIPVVKFMSFYPAEDYHQDYYIKNPNHYKRYERASGRIEFINKYINNFNQ